LSAKARAPVQNLPHGFLAFVEKGPQDLGRNLVPVQAKGAANSVNLQKRLLDVKGHTDALTAGRLVIDPGKPDRLAHLRIFHRDRARNDRNVGASAGHESEAHQP
jgi:hypothetical protein